MPDNSSFYTFLQKLKDIHPDIESVSVRITTSGLCYFLFSLAGERRLTIALAQSQMRASDASLFNTVRDKFDQALTDGTVTTITRDTNLSVW